MSLIPAGEYRKTRGIIRLDTRANQPLATEVLEGTLYFVSDESVIERSNGTTWDDVTPVPGIVGDVVGPAVAVDNAIARFDGTTGKLIQSSGIIVSDAGYLGIGIVPTEPIHVNLGADVNGQIRIASTDAVGVNASAHFVAVANSTDFTLSAHGAGRVVSRWGITLGNWSELHTSSGNGLIIGTRQAAPLVFGTNLLERMRIDSAGNIVVNPSTFVIKTNTVDEADSKRVFISGGGDIGAARGSYIMVSGNENAEAGSFELGVGNVAGAIFQLRKSDASVGIFMDGATGNIGFGVSTLGASAVNIIGIKNGTAPSSSPAGMGQIYVEAGALKYRGSSGTITTLGNA